MANLALALWFGVWIGFCGCLLMLMAGWIKVSRYGKNLVAGGECQCNICGVCGGKVAGGYHHCTEKVTKKNV